MRDKIEFTLQDVANMDEAMSLLPENGKPSFNPHNVHPHVLHDHGFVVCVVFASHLQDALDEAVDQNKLDAFLISEENNTPGKTGLHAEDYPTLGTENEEGITRLGNASEPFDVESIEVIEMTNEAFFSQLLAVQLVA